MNNKTRHVGMKKRSLDLRDDCCDLCDRVNGCSQAVPRCAPEDEPFKVCAGCAPCERFKAPEFRTGLDLIGRL